jgi:site-specific recombinase XerD
MARKTKAPRKPKAPGYFEERGSSIRVTLTVAGKRHKFTLPTTDMDAAERFAKEKFAELEKQAARMREGLPGPMLISALFDKFESDVLPTVSVGTAKAYTASLKRFREFFVGSKDRAVDQIRSGHIAEFLTWRRGARVGGKGGKSKTNKPLHMRSLQKDRTVLHRVFAYAEEIELRDGNPVAKTKPPKADARDYVILDGDQYERLLAECEVDPMLYVYALVLGETGVRCESEAAWLRWEDVDLADGFLKVASGHSGHRTKSGKSRYVPLTPRLAQALREHFLRFRGAQYGGKSSLWVFHHTTTRRHHKAGARLVSMRDAFNDAADRAELPRAFRPHDLRHRRVTSWLAEGKSPVLVKEALGHADLRTTMGYTHLVRANLRALVEPTPMAGAM